MKDILKACAIAITIIVLMVLAIMTINRSMAMLITAFPVVTSFIVVCAIIVLIAYLSHQIYIQKYK